MTVNRVHLGKRAHRSEVDAAKVVEAVLNRNPMRLEHPDRWVEGDDCMWCGAHRACPVRDVRPGPVNHAEGCAWVLAGGTHEMQQALDDRDAGIAVTLPAPDPSVFTSIKDISLPNLVEASEPEVLTGTFDVDVSEITDLKKENADLRSVLAAAAMSAPDGVLRVFEKHLQALGAADEITLHTDEAQHETRIRVAQKKA